MHHIPDLISTGVGDRVDKLTFRLDPAELGTVHVTLHRTDDGVAVTLRSGVAAHAHLADIERIVRAQLEASGMSLTGWNVTTDSDAGSDPGGQARGGADRDTDGEGAGRHDGRPRPGTDARAHDRTVPHQHRRGPAADGTDLWL